MIGRTRTAGHGTVEVELKYRLASVPAGERYLVADELAGLRPTSRPRTTQLEDRYLDTSDGALARAGFAARLRVSTAGTIVSVKSMARRRDRNALHRREELEGPADRTSSPRDWPPSDARSLMLELCGEAPLVEVVTIRQLRRHRELRDGPTVVELSLDEVDVVARSQLVDRFSELEVELVRGDEERLVAIAGVLDADPGLDSSRGSKLEAALAAVRAHVRRHGPLPELGDEDEPEPAPEAPAVAPASPPPPVRQRVAAAARRGAARRPGTRRPARRVAVIAPPPSPRLSAVRGGVAAVDTVADARRKLLRRHFAGLVAAEASVRARGDAEDVAAMRAAGARLVGVWAFFGEGAPAVRPFRRRVATLLDRVDAVRELDVLVAAASGSAAAAPAQPGGLEPLVAAWHAQRDDARRALVRGLESDEHRVFLDELGVLLRRHHRAAGGAAPSESDRVRDVAGSRLWAAYERLAAQEPGRTRVAHDRIADPTEATESLETAIAVLAAALGPEVRPVRDRVTELGDSLRAVRDARLVVAAARAFVDDEADPLVDEELSAVAAWAASREREAARLERALEGPWRDVTGIRVRRGLALAIARL